MPWSVWWSLHLQPRRPHSSCRTYRSLTSLTNQTITELQWKHEWGHSQGYPAVELWFYPLDFWSNVMNLHAVFVSHHHVVCSPGVCPQDHTILTDKNKEYKINKWITETEGRSSPHVVSLLMGSWYPAWQPLSPVCKCVWLCESDKCFKSALSGGGV